MRIGTGILSDREIAIICLVAHGYSSAEIGESLDFTKSSINVWLAEIQHRLGLQRRTHIVIYALKVGLVRLEDIELPGQAKKSEVMQ